MNSSKGRVHSIGIRREEKSCWERRVALAPQHVQELLRENADLRFIVQPCDKRIFSDSEYEAAGATISEDLSPCEVIFGVKEVPIECLLPDRTYVFFSHTIKAQEKNMPTLDHVMRSNIRLIDYEKITDERGQRLVAFGRFAGIAGSIDFLSGLGVFLLHKGFATAFLNVSPSYKYFSLRHAFEHIHRCGLKLAQEQIPERLRPLVFAITGKGRCSMGAYEVLQNFPHKVVDPDDLERLVADRANPAHRETVYVTFIESQHMVRDKTGKPFDKKEYYAHPEHFEGDFHARYLPYISAIFHNMYWDDRFPRLISTAQMRELTQSGRSRLLGIGDVTCDADGSIEWLHHFTTPDQPFWVYNTVTGDIIHDNVCPSDEWILYDSLDFLPTELAFDSSMHFSTQLKQFVPSIARSNSRATNIDEQGLVPQIKRAVIAYCNRLAPDFEYIAKLRQKKEAERAKKSTQVAAGATPSLALPPPQQKTPATSGYQQQHGAPSSPITTNGSKELEKKNLPIVQAHDDAHGAHANKLASVMLFKLVGDIFRSGVFSQVLNIVAADGGSFKIIDVVSAPAGQDANSYMIVMIRSYESTIAERVTNDIYQLSEKHGFRVEDLLASDLSRIQFANDTISLAPKL